MQKVTKQERDSILESIVQAEIMRFSLEETINLVKEKTDCDISVFYLSELRKSIREKGRQYIGSRIKEKMYTFANILN